MNLVSTVGQNSMYIVIICCGLEVSMSASDSIVWGSSPSSSIKGLVNPYVEEKKPEKEDNKSAYSAQDPQSTVL